MRLTLYAQISPSSMAYVRPDHLEADLLQWCSFVKSPMETYVQLGTVEIDIELDTDQNSLVQKAVAGLRMEQADVRAKASKECNDIEKKVQQLLAIENKPSAPEVVGEVLDETDR